MTRAPRPTPYTRDTAPPFLTYEEAAAVLNVSDSAVAEAVRTGNLPCIRITPKTPRIPREALWAELSGMSASAVDDAPVKIALELLARATDLLRAAERALNGGKDEVP